MQARVVRWRFRGGADTSAHNSQLEPHYFIVSLPTAEDRISPERERCDSG